MIGDKLLIRYSDREDDIKCNLSCKSKHQVNEGEPRDRKSPVEENNNSLARQWYEQNVSLFVFISLSSAFFLSIYLSMLFLW
jgi:hypothetical protein